MQDNWLKMLGPITKNLYFRRLYIKKINIQNSLLKYKTEYTKYNYKKYCIQKCKIMGDIHKQIKYLIKISICK